MKIQCPVGRYDTPVEHTTCLSCSRSNFRKCNFSYPLLKAIYASNDDRTKEIHVTDLNECLLRAYYSKVEPAPIDPAEQLVMFAGKAVHEYIGKFVENDVFFESEVPVDRIGITGRADLVSDEEIIDVKTTRWMKPTALPYGSHATQVNVYHWMLDQYEKKGDRKLQVQYIDLTGPTRCRKCKSLYNHNGLCRCGIPMPENAHLGVALVDIPVVDSNELGESLAVRKHILRQAIDNGVPPEAEPGWICSYCPFSQCQYYSVGQE